MHPSFFGLDQLGQEQKKVQLRFFFTWVSWVRTEKKIISLFFGLGQLDQEQKKCLFSKANTLASWLVFFTLATHSLPS